MAEEGVRKNPARASRVAPVRYEDTQESSSRRPANRNQTSNDGSYTVERILARRKIGKRLEYMVKWKNFAEHQSTWEPAENLNCPRLVSAFERNRESGYAKGVPEPPPKLSKIPKPNCRLSPISSADEEEKAKPRKMVKKVHGLTTASGKLQYLCCFVDDTFALVSRRDMHNHYSRQLEKFYKDKARERELQEMGMSESEREELKEQKMKTVSPLLQHHL
ncbi:unnamed protein product [Caenorhabditis nigoni]